MTRKKLTTNEEKTAAILLILGEELAAQIISEMDDLSVKAITQAMAKLGPIDSDSSHELIEDFHTYLLKEKNTISGGQNKTRSLLEKAFGKEKSQEFLPARSFAKKLASLQFVPAQNLAHFLTEENPQTTAIVLAFLPSDYAAALIKNLPKKHALEALQGLSSLEPLSETLLEDIYLSLKKYLSEHQKETSTHGGITHTAAVLNALEPELSRELLDSIQKRDPDLAEKIDEKIFSFTDLVDLSLADMQVLLKNTKDTDWLLALRKTSDAVKDKFFSSISARKAKLLKEELKSMKPHPLRDVEAAQKKITDKVRQLEKEGKIFPGETLV